MKRYALLLALLALATTGLGAQKPKPEPPKKRDEPPVLREEKRRTDSEPIHLEKANVLPLALDDAIQFRKTETFFVDPSLWQQTFNPSINFERQRVFFGAVTQVDRRERYGEYFTFFWRAKRQADLTVRFEYRQRNLGSYVQAQEIKFPGAKGSLKTDFKVVGNDYEEDGRVTAWRALLIENGKIVALNQSFLWK